MKNFIKPLAIATILLGSAGAAFAVCTYTQNDATAVTSNTAVTPTTDDTKPVYGIVIADSAYIYAKPSAEPGVQILSTLFKDDIVEYIVTQGTFRKIRFNGIEGYVDKTDIKRASEGQVPQTLGNAGKPEVDSTHAQGTPATFPCPMKSITVGKKTFKVADLNDVSKVYKDNVNQTNCFFVVSKQEFRLYVYEVEAGDTTLVAHYPVCYAKYPEGKTRQGDMRTPDCNMKAPFRISQICNASSWMHNFGDGRGNIPAYGSWFIRLDLSKSNVPAAIKSNRSIGIHGSSANKESVPGMDSEGCIRLRDTDIRDLKTRFAQVGTKVVVLPYNQGKLPFMKKAEKKLGTAYQYATKGYKTY